MSYMLTAWYATPADMHQAMDTIMIELSAYSVLDITFSDVLQQLEPTAYMEVGTPPDNRTVSELWDALGNSPLPCVNVVVTLPIDRYKTTSPTPISGPPVQDVLVNSDVK
uniref:Pvc16 family protein n=1 Tax=Kitasatospora sp. NBC_01519 TaxID=2903576 RepID=UPI002F90A008